MTFSPDEQKQGRIPVIKLVDYRKKMRRQSRQQEKLAALFFVGALIFNYPLLAIFSQDGFIFGLPIPYVYLFSVWLVLIAFIAWINGRSHPS